MDSSKYNLGNEGCSSSESGWTTYIASPMEEDDDHDHDHHCGDYYEYSDKHGPAKTGIGDEDSDDSMASDASSAPRGYQKPDDDEVSNGKASFKPGKVNNNFTNESSASRPNRKEKSKGIDHSSGKTKKGKILAPNRKYSK